MSNYPPGTGPNDPRAPWNQDESLCENCGEPVEPGQDCENCGEYALTEEDHYDAAMDAKYDQMKDDGRL